MTLTPSSMVPLGMRMPAFSLPDPTGPQFDSADLSANPTLVAFIYNHCPYVKHIAPALYEFVHEYREAGLTVITINSNDFESHPNDSPKRNR